MNNEPNINGAAGQSPENAPKDIRFTAGGFSLVLTHPADVKLPDDIMRLVTGINRKLEEMARRRATLST